MPSCLYIDNQNINKYYKKGLVVDSELLLVYLIGVYDQSYLLAYKRTRAYSKTDFIILNGFFENFASIITTPHILTEISHLSDAIQKSRLKEFIKVFIDRINNLQEVFIGKHRIVKHEDFERLGVADTGIMITCDEKKYLMLTKDRLLTDLARKNGVDVINFDEYRGYKYLYY